MKRSSFLKQINFNFLVCGGNETAKFHQKTHTKSYKSVRFFKFSKKKLGENRNSNFQMPQPHSINWKKNLFTLKISHQNPRQALLLCKRIILEIDRVLSSTVHTNSVTGIINFALHNFRKSPKR